MHNSVASKNARPNAAKTIRCAIYTRKSTEEGLDQDFNSLHAQREAAEAYIQSQKECGWTRLFTTMFGPARSGREPTTAPSSALSFTQVFLSQFWSFTNWSIWTLGGKVFGIIPHLAR